MCVLEGEIRGHRRRVSVPLRVHSGIYWHWAREDGDPYKCPIQHQYPGRYNKAGSVGRWYGAGCPMGAWCEWRHWNQFLDPVYPIRMGYFKVANARVVDLTDLTVLNKFGIGWVDLQPNVDYTLTQQIGELIINHNEADGFIAPSARYDAHSVVVLRHDVLGRLVEPLYAAPAPLQAPPHYLSRIKAYPP